MTDKSKRVQLFALADTVADAILDMSDEEILAELEEEGIRPEDAGKAFDSLSDSARMKAGQKELARARQAMKAAQQSAVRRRAMSADEARAIIARAGTELSDLTQAARNAKSGKMPDQEAFDLLDDLTELGYKFDGANDE